MLWEITDPAKYITCKIIQYNTMKLDMYNDNFNIEENFIHRNISIFSTKNLFHLCIKNSNFHDYVT